MVVFAVAGVVVRVVVIGVVLGAMWLVCSARSRS